jgi:hypothetical protein
VIGFIIFCAIAFFVGGGLLAWALVAGGTRK